MSRPPSESELAPLLLQPSEDSKISMDHSHSSESKFEPLLDSWISPNLLATQWDELSEIHEIENDLSLQTPRLNPFQMFPTDPESSAEEENIYEDDKQAEPAPTELKFNPDLIPKQKIAVNSLDAEITTLLAKLNHRILELAKQELAFKDPSFRVDELKGINWNPFLTRKYESFVFTLLPHDPTNYWAKVEKLFVKVFGSEEAQQIFDGLMSALPDGVTIVNHKDTSSILYEYTALCNLEGIFASAKQYIDDQTRRHDIDKILAIQKIINEKYQQVTDQIQLVLEKPTEAEKAFNLTLFDSGGEINHKNHAKLFEKITLQFNNEVLAQLSHLEFFSYLPNDVLFNNVFNQFSKYQGMMKKNNIKLSSDLLYIYSTKGVQHTIFYNLHQSPTQAQKLQDLAGQKKSSSHNLVGDTKEELTSPPKHGGELPEVSTSESLELEPQVSTDSELNRLPNKYKTTHGIWWQDPSTGQFEVQVGIESTTFDTPLTKTVKTTNPHHLAMKVLLNLQQQAQEARKDKIVFHLLAYNQSSKEDFLELSFIHSFSLFLSHEISPIIDDSVNNRIHLTSHKLFEIMKTAIKKFEIKVGIEIPEEVLYILTGAATEIAYSRTIYTHVLNLNSNLKYQYDALRMAQYWMEYPAATGLEPTHPGFIYFVWPIIDKISDYRSISGVKPDITRLNEASMIELFLLFKKYFDEDNIVAVTQSLDFKPYYDIRMPVVAAAGRYHLNLITPIIPRKACKVVVLIDRELDLDQQASVAAGDYIFILEKKVSFQLYFQKGKTIQSKPMTSQDVFANLTFIVMNAKQGTRYIQLTNEEDLAHVFNLCKSWGGTPRRKDEEIKAAEERRQQEIIASLAEFKIAEQAFFNAVQPIYLKVQKKILDSKPTTEAGMVLKLLFNKIKNRSYYSETVGLKPALTHLLVFFMNERDGLSLQAAGGSDGSGDRWLHVEKIFNTLKLYGFNREKLGNLDRGTKDIISVKRRPQRKFEKQERTRPSSNDLLILSANNHHFFQFWLKRKPSSALDAHTLKLYQYCAHHWLSLEERLALTQEIKITDEHKSKDREDLNKLNSFWQRETRKIEVQLLEEKELEYDFFTSPNNPLAEAIYRFHHQLTHYLHSKRAEITLYCTKNEQDLHPQLEKILNELTKKHITLLQKFELIERCNYLGLELSANMERSGPLIYTSNYNNTVKKYACFTPVRSIFEVISSLNFRTQEDFIYSLNLHVNKIHPNDIYCYLFKKIPHLNPLISKKEAWPPEQKFIYEELEKVKTYCNDGESGLKPPEIKVPFGTSIAGQESLGKLQIYWQQQRLLHHIKQEEKVGFKLNKKLSATINQFYDHFRKLSSQLFTKDLQNWEVAWICRERQTVTDKYDFIIDLYYLGKLNDINKKYDSVVFSNITYYIANFVKFNDPDKFISSLNDHVMLLVAKPDDPYTAPNMY